MSSSLADKEDLILLVLLWPKQSFNIKGTGFCFDLSHRVHEVAWMPLKIMFFRRNLFKWSVLKPLITSPHYSGFEF